MTTQTGHTCPLSTTTHIIRPLSRIDGGLLIVAVLMLLVLQPLMQPGLPSGADNALHLYRFVEYERAWAPGVIVPRWAPNLAYGYGYPIFNFVPQLPYLLALLFHLIGFSHVAALKGVIVLAVVLHGIGMYLLARDVFSSVAAGMVAAVAYAFAPFTLRETLLVGGNVPQLLAIGLFPAVLWAMTRAARTGRWLWLILAAVGFAGVVLSHLFQALVFTGIVAVYGLVVALIETRLNKRNHRNFWLPNLTIPLGMLLAAFSWLPALVERFYTRAQADIYLEKSPFYIRYPYLPELLAWISPLDARAANPHIPLALGWMTLALVAVGVVGWFIWRRWEVGGYVLFFGAMAGVSIFLTLPVSRPVWELVPPLQVAQFPWRLFGVTNLGLAMLAGAAIFWLPLRSPWAVTVPVVLLQLWTVAPLLYPPTDFAHYDAPNLAEQINFERRSQSVGTNTLGEYFPLTVTDIPGTSPLVEAFQRGDFPPRLDFDSLPADASAELLEQTAVTHRYRVTSSSDVTVRFFQVMFPGWRASLNGEPLPLRAEAESGLILADIPAGEHTLTFRFGETPIRLAGLGLSAVGVLVVVGLAFLPASKSEPTLPEVPLTSPVVWSLAVGIVVLAFVGKPLLRSVFTLDSPPGEIIPAQHQTRVEFADGLYITGYDVSRRVVGAGEYLQVVLYWETDTAPMSENLQPFVHLDRLNTWETLAGSTNYTPGDVTTESNLPTFHWDNSRYVRDEHDLIIPGDAAPIAYAVRAGLIDPETDQRIPLSDGSGDTALLTTINVESPRPPRDESLAVFSQGDDSAVLAAYELIAVSPTQLEFQLVWHTEHPLHADYVVFAQLLDADGQWVAGRDSPPLDGAYPTSTWLPNQHITDRRFLPLPDAITPGDYQLIAGLYHAETGQRMTTANGTDFVTLDTITIAD